jgi:hypothetical protein
MSLSWGYDAYWGLKYIRSSSEIQARAILGTASQRLDALLCHEYHREASAYTQSLEDENGAVFEPGQWHRPENVTCTRHNFPLPAKDCCSPRGMFYGVEFP